MEFDGVDPDEGVGEGVLGYEVAVEGVVDGVTCVGDGFIKVLDGC